jgi:hypothetical protein
MSDASHNDGRSNALPGDKGVLTNLPRTRPQRPSPRRTAARSAPSRAGAPVKDADANRTARKAVPGDTRVRRPTGTTTKPAKASRQPRPSAPDVAPRQGFECDSDTVSGPVQPPGGAELVASAAEILGELAKGGLSTGERLVKDIISRLPLS